MVREEQVKIAKEEKQETRTQDAIVCEELHEEDAYEGPVCEQEDEDQKQVDEDRVYEQQEGEKKKQDEEEKSASIDEMSEMKETSVSEVAADVEEGSTRAEASATRTPRVTLVRLKDGERRGFWSNHELPKNQSIQAFVHGAVNDQELPLMLDTGANISILHTNLARKLGVGVRMFRDPTSFYGVSQDPVGAHGMAKVKVRLGQWVVFEMDVWVADFEANSLLILGTDFMVRAGVVVDLKSRECKIPGEGPLKLLTHEMMKIPKYLKMKEKVREAGSKKLRWLSRRAVLSVGDAPPAVFSVDSVLPSEVDQSSLDREVYIHEGVEMSADSMAEQLALIPEIDPEPPDPADMTTADVGEEGETTPAEEKKVRDILESRGEQFISSGNALPAPAKGVVCDVDVGDSKPVAQRARRVPPHLLGKLYELLRGLLRAGLIRYSSSPWASPIVIVLKKNGKDIRLCIDYRLVNSLTKLMVYAMPLIDDLLDNFEHVMWLCSMDNASGYWAVLMTARAREITAFICPLGHFEWLRMPQGLKNAPQIYQRIIDNALWTMVRMISNKGVRCRVVGLSKEEAEALTDGQASEHVDTDLKLMDDVFHAGVAEMTDSAPVIGRRSYIDDVTFGACSWDELCIMLECLLEAFKYWGITISLPKSSFGKKAVEFLSHEVSRDGLRAVPRNLESILSMSFPTTVKGIQKFVGSLIYYHRFIDNFATYASALYEVTDLKLRDGTQLEHAKNAFEALKKRLCGAPMLRHLERDRELVIILYTNKWAFGATVCQEYDGVLHPVRFVSKVFKDAETRYTGAEQEVLALLKTLEVASHFLFGQQITVYARYSTMKWLFTSKSVSGRAVQWAVMLSPWNLKIVRSDQEVVGLTAVLAASIVPRSVLDAALEDIAPMKTIHDTPVIRPIPELRRDSGGYVLTFDGAVRVKGEKVGTYGMVLWELPEWTVVDAEYAIQPELTVNDSEYHGLIGALELAIKHGIRKVIVCGDSRIVIGQVNGDLRCNQASLQVWLNRVRALLETFEGVSLVHVARKYNQPADLLTRKAMSSQSGGRVEAEAARDDLRLLNTLPELLYRTADQLEPGEGPTATSEDQPQSEAASRELEPEDNTKLTDGPTVNSIAAGHETPVEFGTDTRRPDGGWWREEEPKMFVHVATRSKKALDEPQARQKNVKKKKAKTRSPSQMEPVSVSRRDDAAAEGALRVTEATLVAAQEERFRRIAVAQGQDGWCAKVIAYLRGDEEAFPSATALKKVAKVAELYVLDAAGVLYYSPYDKRRAEDRMRLVVPSVLQEDVLRAYHTELGGGAHQGVGRVFARLRELYYWRGLYADVEWFVASCEDCATGKGKPRYRGRTEGNITATRPFQVLAMDFAIPLPKTHDGNEALLCFICIFSGYVVLIPMEDTSAQSVAEAYLSGVYKRFGAQEAIRHDRDPRFMSSVFRRFNRMMKQKQRPTLAYRPQANGKQERSVQTVVRAIKSYIADADQRDWDEYVEQLELALNTSVSLQHGQTSFYLVHGWSARTALEAVVPPKDGTVKETDALAWRQKTVKQHERAMAHAEFIQQKLMEARVTKHNKMVKDTTKGTIRTAYQPGELVWIYHDLVKTGLVRKFSHLWHGPYQIEDRVSEVVYRLKIDKKESRIFPMVHISRLKPFVSRMSRPRERLQLQDAGEFDEALLPEDSWYEPGEDDEYEVEAILDYQYKQRTRNGRWQKEYKVKWVGYDEPSWVAEEDLNCTALLYEFDARRAWENRREAAQTAEEVNEDELSEDDEEEKEDDVEAAVDEGEDSSTSKE